MRAKLPQHLFATRRQQRPDVIVDEVVEDHGLQRGIVVNDEDGRLTIIAALLGAIGQ